ncbi:phosphoglucosamine mutase [Pseudobacter ginsenosidimutans]|uniref:Phosphomannomutase n=1 Tax=Pseudobacter ginsenosidimutans TaxID=661488 RepID=A0A4Q7MFL7_9BACT|nr:phosphoglucosamine mutase [Pseudobacter ginsenosidimutans]QEC45436.1 phosphoglucosamine mutase [Pseudobacter ginsenosidimutans]RZS66966.1 phosphomannomutase [Pseudobacter ginsenosidimutans]
MALIKSISGIRGTIGGTPGDNLTPLDIVKFTAAYGSWILSKEELPRKIVIGRDGRISGAMVQQLIVNTLIGMGIDVVDTGLSTTPTVEMAVVWENAGGGIIITASHNPKEWNALKLLNNIGEFISGEDGAIILETAAKEDFKFANVDKLGEYTVNDTTLQRHIDTIVDYPLVDVKAIKEKGYKVVVDVINSTGALVLPGLLKALGVAEVILLNGEVTGKFAHNPEPLPENLTELANAVRHHRADMGIAVDPDVDRLCFVCEDGSMFGEEYTLVAVADYVLSKRPGNTVSNMSSTKALKEITISRGGEYFPSAVGEVNVVKKMKEKNAVIGGEGNGGIIVPDLHYGRDALIGIGLFLSALAAHKNGIKSFRAKYPDYFISKNKIELTNGIDLKAIFEHIKKKYKNQPINTEDGLKIEFDSDWVHLRSSNTEPIIRIYAESNFETTANNIALRLMQDIRESI